MKAFKDWLAQGLVEISNETGTWAVRGFAFALGAMTCLKMLFF